MSDSGTELKNIGNQAQSWCERLSFPALLVDFESLKVIYSNDRCAELTGKGNQTLCGSDWCSLFDPQSHETLSSIVEIYSLNFDAFTPIEHNLKVIRRTGRTVPVVGSFSGITSGGRRILLLSLFDQSKDVDEKKRLTEDLKAIYNMSKLADLGRIAASVAHEMNNPLMVIQGQAEIMELKASKSPLPKEQIEKILQPVYRSVERISRIVSQMKTAAGNPEVELVNMDLVGVIKRALSLISERAKFLGVEINLDLSESLLVCGNPEQLEHVVLNIVNNALDAMEDNGFQKQSGYKLRVQAKEFEGFAVVEFWNNGPSIPFELQENVMSPFFSTKDIGKGIGLGLAVSHGILRSYHGGFRLKYSNDEGTCFEMKIPVATVDGNENRVKALVVDDENYVRRVLAERLEAEGFEVVAADNGQVALEMLLKHPDIAIIFTDLRMPVMNGVDLIRQVRNIMNDVMIVVVSGYMDTLKQAADQNLLVVEEYLEKPFTSHEFREVLSSLRAKLNNRSKKNVAAA